MEQIRTQNAVQPESLEVLKSTNLQRKWLVKKMKKVAERSRGPVSKKLCSTGIKKNHGSNSFSVIVFMQYCSVHPLSLRLFRYKLEGYPLK